MSESSYIVRQNGVVVGVLCKKCGVPIRGLVPVAEPIDTRKANGMVIRDNFMMLGTGSNYTEVEIETEADGKKAKHVTPMCKTCADRLTTADLDAIIDADLDDFERDGSDVKHLRKFRPTKLLKKGR